MGQQRYPGAHHLYFDDNGPMSVSVPDNILHIAASAWNIAEDDPRNPDRGIAGWINEGDTEAHTYNDEHGNMQQYVDLNVRVSGTLEGNYRNRTHESWNPEGLNGATSQYNSSRWTAAQCERFSDFLAWDSMQNGTVLADMRNSLPSSHGVGFHRYGVDQAGEFDRVPGGENWTRSRGKVCPGTARVRQGAGIIARAVVLRNLRVAPLPPGRVDLPAALARGTGKPLNWFEAATVLEVARAVK